MRIKISKPDDFEIAFVGGKKLQEQTADMVKDGKATFINKDSQDAKNLLVGQPELAGEDVAVVVNKEGTSEETCRISAVGESVIIHCADRIIPVKEPVDDSAPIKKPSKKEAVFARAIAEESGDADIKMAARAYTSGKITEPEWVACLANLDVKPEELFARAEQRLKKEK